MAELPKMLSSMRDCKLPRSSTLAQMKSKKHTEAWLINITQTRAVIKPDSKILVLRTTT
jgi:hypothetical protein